MYAFPVQIHERMACWGSDEPCLTSEGAVPHTLTDAGSWHMPIAVSLYTTIIHVWLHLCYTWLSTVCLIYLMNVCPYNRTVNTHGVRLKVPWRTDRGQCGAPQAQHTLLCALLLRRENWNTVVPGRTSLIYYVTELVCQINLLTENQKIWPPTGHDHPLSLTGHLVRDIARGSEGPQKHHQSCGGG